MLRGGIVGLGNVARNGHLPAWLARPDVRITAAADVRPESRAAAAGPLPDLAWHDSAESLLGSEDLDFVDVCTPPAAHGAAVREALARGLHVLCEKPLVLEPGELAGLGALARARGRVLSSVHNWRYAPQIAAASAAIAEGRIGAVRRCRWEVLRDRPSAAAPLDGAPNWRIDPALSGGGILFDHGWHAVYIVDAWIPGRLCRVAGRLETRKHRQWPVEDTADVRLEFEGGEARIFLTWAATERSNRVVVEGTSGTIRIEGRRLEVESPRGIDRRDFSGSLAEGSHHPDWFAGVAEEFVDEIAAPRARGRSLAEAAVCLEAIRRAYESSRRGGAAMAAAAETECPPARAAESLR